VVLTVLDSFLKQCSLVTDVTRALKPIHTADADATQLDS